jgi:hypothetical protein
MKVKVNQQFPDKDPSIYKIPQGACMGRITAIIDKEGVKTEFEGEVKIVNQLDLVIETEHRYINPVDGKEYPKTITQTVTKSWHEKSKMPKVINSILGKSMTDEEKNEFDILSLLGMYVNITVIERISKTGKVRNEIASFSPLFKGQPTFDCLYEPYVFSFDEDVCPYLNQLALLDASDRRIVSYTKEALKETKAYTEWVNRHAGLIL